MSTEFKLGALDSPPDSRDFNFDQRSKKFTEGVKLPKHFDLRKFLPSIINQGSKGSCVACVGACIKEFHERIDTNYHGHFSIDFIYFYRQNKPIEGMFPRDLMNILQKKGCCSEYKCPYNNSDDLSSLPNGSDREAAHYKIFHYFRISTFDDLKKALVENGPCYISFPVYNFGKRLWKKGQNDKLRGYHAMTVVGYKKDRFILRNSWGKDWGNKGYTSYKFNEYGAHREIWTCNDVKGSRELKDKKKKKKKDKKDKDKCLCF